MHVACGMLCREASPVVSPYMHVPGRSHISRQRTCMKHVRGTAWVCRVCADAEHGTTARQSCCSGTAAAPAYLACKQRGAQRSQPTQQVESTSARRHALRRRGNQRSSRRPQRLSLRAFAGIASVVTIEAVGAGRCAPVPRDFLAQSSVVRRGHPALHCGQTTAPEPRV